MTTKKEILELVEKFVNEKEESESWTPGEDWVSYSGPYFDSKEYVAAVNRLLDGWLIFGEKAREFELKFSEELGKKYGMLTNSGSSANLLMVSALTSRRAGKLQLKKATRLLRPSYAFQQP